MCKEFRRLSVTNYLDPGSNLSAAVHLPAITDHDKLRGHPLGAIDARKVLRRGNGLVVDCLEDVTGLQMHLGGDAALGRRVDEDPAGGVAAHAAGDLGELAAVGGFLDFRRCHEGWAGTCVLP